MFFQFEKVNMTMIEKKLNLAYIRSLFVTTNDVKFLNQANFLAAEIEKHESQDIKKTTLNEKINFIETTFNSIGAIDKHKMDAGRFYSMFNLAIDKIESQRKASHGDN